MSARADRKTLSPLIRRCGVPKLCSRRWSGRFAARTDFGTRHARRRYGSASGRMTPKNSERGRGGDLPEVSAGEESPKLRVLRRATAVVVARGDRVGGLSAGTSSSPEREFAHPRRVEAALSGRSAKIAAVALAIALLLLFLVALLGAASFTPRPLAAAAVLIGLCAGALTAFATSDPYLVACAACLPTCALFTLQ